MPTLSAYTGKLVGYAVFLSEFVEELARGTSASGGDVFETLTDAFFFTAQSGAVAAYQ
jgi:hypothetical protein